jgi:hypothetical protein
MINVQFQFEVAVFAQGVKLVVNCSKKLERTIPKAIGSDATEAI